MKSLILLFVTTSAAWTQSVSGGAWALKGTAGLASTPPSGTMTGCGAGAGGASVYDQSTCGNYSGAPYEDLNTASPTTPPSPFGSGTVHKIAACTAIVPTAGDVWRFTGDVNDGVGGTNQNCIHFAGQSANNFIIDLAGFALTGGIHCDQTLGGNDCSGITIVNGAITCNLANGGSLACINMIQGGNPSKSIMLSHLTVNNSNSPLNKDAGYSGFEFAILVEPNGTMPTTCPAGAGQKTFNNSCVEVAHLTVTNTAGYTGVGYVGWCARCTDIFLAANGGGSAEVWNTITNNGAFVDANQGIVFFHIAGGSAHNNYFPWVSYSGSSDTGRPILFDCSGKPFCQDGGSAFNNLIEAYNNRCVRTRQVNNVLIHDNRFEHVESVLAYPCISMGGNGDYAEKIDGNVVSHNTFLHAGGYDIGELEAYGSVADANTFLCDGIGGCAGGSLVETQISEGTNGLTFAVSSATRTAQCAVTLVLSVAPVTTSLITGLYVNISGTGSSFDVSATAGNTITTYNLSTKTITYTQSGCSGAASIGAGGIFWISQSSNDAFAGNGAEIYVKNSTVDPMLTMAQPFVACGTASPACLNTPQTTLNGGQTQMQWCNNPAVPISGVGALVTHVTPDSACP